MAEYARSNIGRKALMTELLNSIEDTRKKLNKEGIAAKNVITTTQQNWKGEDADLFLRNFRSSLNTLDQKLTNYKTILQQALDQDARKFAQQQQINGNSIKKIEFN